LADTFQPAVWKNFPAKIVKNQRLKTPGKNPPERLLFARKLLPENARQEKKYMP
jgi:hypothetical protein